MSAAGLYDSFFNRNTSNLIDVHNAIKSVWASLYSRRAILSRKSIGLKQESACMSVLVQEMIQSEYSFVLHSCDPITNSENHVYGEIALGLGETLASGKQGTPWRLRIEKDTK